MSEEAQEQRNKARGLAVDAAAAWVDQWPGWEGAIITGYVLVIETVRLGHPASLTWMTGNGAQPTGAEDGSLESAPIPSWRVRGMCAEVISELDGQEAVRQLRILEDE